MKFTTTIASAAVAGVLGLAGVSVAGAADSGSVPSTTGTTASSTSTTSTTAAPGAAQNPTGHQGRRAKRAERRRHRRRQIAAIAARTIDITPRDLVRELRDGKTIAQIATDHGVQPQAVIDALEGAATKRIDAAQAANKITAERAARLKQRVANVTPRIVDNWHPRTRARG